MRKKVLTMANVKNKKNHHKTKSLLLIILLLVIAGFGYFLYTKLVDNEKQTTNDSTVTNTNAVTNNTQATNNINTEDPETKTNTENNNADSPTATGSLSDSTITIEPVTQQNGYISVRSKVKSSVAGSCYFGFSSNSDRPVSRSRTSTPNPENSTEQLCDIDVNEVEFTKLGDWKVTVIFSIGNDKVEESVNAQIN